MEDCRNEKNERENEKPKQKGAKGVPTKRERKQV
jgi:hypothetical protein